MNTISEETSTNEHSPLIAMLCLRIIVFLQCVGVGGRYLFSQHESESDVYGLLFFDWQWPETLAQQIDDGGMMACFAAGWVTLVGVFLSVSKTANKIELSSWLKAWRFLECGACCVVAAWILLLASTHMVRGEIYAELSYGEQAVRFTSPLVLLLLIVKPRLHFLATVLLAFASFFTFAVHGYKALNCYGPFVDLILLSNERLAWFDITQSSAENLLLIIGGLDIVVAVLLIPARWRWVAMYMVVWGMITATSRMTAFGWSAWPETAIRAANWGAPLALFLLMNLKRQNSSEQPTGKNRNHA